MAGSFSLSFASAPALLPAYAKIALARKARAPIASLPRMEAKLTGFRIDPRQLARYRSVCCERGSDTLPLTYPHVMATPVHLAMIASDSFPVSLLGVVHVRNRIVQQRPLHVEETGDIHCSIDGCRATANGQELDLHTRILCADQEVWSETCTLLARVNGSRGTRREARGASPGVGMAEHAEVRTLDFTVDSGTGRRYARVSGDFNPIHMADVVARLFGFKRAIAHGMWSLARCIAEMGSEVPAGPCALDVAFKLPIALPARVTLQSWSVEAGLGFALRDSRLGRCHLFGTLLSR